jgi:polyisoprenoid-binding protein YceI
LCLIPVRSFAEQRCLQNDRSRFEIAVGTGGLFGAFAHDHLIRANDLQGCAEINLENLGRSSVKLDFKAAALEVMDPKESAADRAEVQKHMREEVLQVDKFPGISFASNSVEGTSKPGDITVIGDLTIRGKTQRIRIPLHIDRQQDGYHATGEYRLKQSDFGIRQVTVMGGTVRVKDELKITFDLYLQ